MKKFFYDPLGTGKAFVDTVVSLTGFALVGGPARQDAPKAVAALMDLNVPYLVSLPLVFQTTEEWLDSDLGVHPVQVALQVGDLGWCTSCSSCGRIGRCMQGETCKCIPCRFGHPHQALTWWLHSSGQHFVYRHTLRILRNNMILSPLLHPHLQVALPELDGALEPIVFAGRDSNTGKSHSLPDRIESLAARAINWAMLRKKKNVDKKLAITGE